jgi:glutamyl-tRNA synthetase
MRLLGAREEDLPRYAHVPMVVAPDGDRLAKRAGGATIRALRERGITAEQIKDTLGAALGVVTGSEDPATWRKDAWPIPATWT